MPRRMLIADEHANDNCAEQRSPSHPTTSPTTGSISAHDRCINFIHQQFVAIAWLSFLDTIPISCETHATDPAQPIWFPLTKFVLSSTSAPTVSFALQPDCFPIWLVANGVVLLPCKCAHTLEYQSVIEQAWCTSFFFCTVW